MYIGLPSLGLHPPGRERPGIPMPTGFDWTTAPIQIYEDGGVYTTNFTAGQWILPADAFLWCSPAGNDTTGTGTQANPYRSLNKCITEASLLSAETITIYCVTGEYAYLGHFSNTSCNKNLNVIAVGGTCLLTNKFALSNAGWTNAGSNTYTRNRTGIAYVRDARYPDPTYPSLPLSLTRVADLAACQALAGSWYTDGTVIGLHMSDNRSPDADTGGDVACIFNAPSLLFNTDRRWFIQGMIFEGSSTDIIRTLGALTSFSRIVMDNCVLRYANTAGRGVSSLGVGLVILNNVKCYYTGGDGFNYHAANGVEPQVIEISCEAYEAGVSGGDNHFNATTTHENARIIRVNGIYARTYGPIVADIGTSQVWNVKCSATNSYLTTDDSQDACFQRGDGATGTTWLEVCNASGSFYSMYADAAGALIRYRGGTLTGSTSGNVATY